MLVVVDDVEDRILENGRDDDSIDANGISPLPRARDVRCSVASGNPPQLIPAATGRGCTLRGTLFDASAKNASKCRSSN